MAIEVSYNNYNDWVVIHIGRSTIQCKVEDLSDKLKTYLGF